MYSRNVFESINLIENILIVGAQNNEDSNYYIIIFIVFFSNILL